jgi:predicted ArsR family transcriptional regulator
MSTASHSRSEDGTTRERLTDLLRRGERTVDELADAVGLTANAVRQHLAALERDGVVARRGPRREGAVGKPATMYGITPDAERSFSRAYAPVLTAILAALPDHVPSAALEAILRDTASRLTADAPVPRGDFRRRVRAGAAALESLGAVTETREGHKGAVIEGCSCPLAEAVVVRPELCRAIEWVLSAVVGAHVEERCDRSTGRPRCRFEITKPSEAA